MNPDPIDDDEPSIVVRPRRKGIYALPNAITLGALFSAFYAIVMAMNGRFEVACVAIFAAAILDSLDGRVARMTNTQSAFGEQMDSLSDMVAFGAAPALIIYMWALKDMGKPGWIPAFVYIAAGLGSPWKKRLSTDPTPHARRRAVGSIGPPTASPCSPGFRW